MDSVGYVRVLRISKRKECYRLDHCYQLPEEAVAEWKSPYEVVFGVTSGTWQQTADIYKRWSVRFMLPVCAKVINILRKML